MLFVIIGRDGPDGKAKRPSLRPAHLAHLEAHRREGRVLLAGPFTDGAGSMILVDVEDLDAARAMADADPYHREGVFESVEIHPFLRVIPEA
jgi:uncharacterized protein YciI